MRKVVDKMGEEKGVEYYDKVFEESEKYAVPPRDSIYYPLWKFGLIEIKKNERILELGCGTGQFAKLALDEGYRYVRGVDFSPVAIEKAKEITGREDLFICADIFDLDIEHDGVVVMFEVLEHVERDRELLKTWRNNHVIFSVPSFDSEGHVRFFHSMKEVEERYSDCCWVYAITRINVNGADIYLVNANTKG